ncbi:SET domain protein [Moumouvirus australiensis]|uniref:SET domain protein n=1 Tax=Moumouvirus australiensis TaxID=2109587 RepID=A0A2P1EKZ9_9VIRU|nr:SET domain protein [Moumouvirus australiensis]AVL94566.1 SET domain protein [Moumouvirus australiensis]
MSYVDSRLIKTVIKGKGRGFIAKENIPANTIILREEPDFFLEVDENTISDMFELLYKIFTSGDNNKINRFLDLTPSTIHNFSNYFDKTRKELEKLKNTKLNHIYDFFKNNFDHDEVTLFCVKYMCNAFEFGNACSILYVGRIFNHSCLPNVIFYRVKNMMYFMTIVEIKKGQELFDNYVDISESKKNRQNRLLNQYGFICDCLRCKDNHKYDNYANFVNNTRKKIISNPDNQTQL